MNKCSSSVRIGLSKVILLTCIFFLLFGVKRSVAIERYRKLSPVLRLDPSDIDIFACKPPHQKLFVPHDIVDIEDSKQNVPLRLTKQQLIQFLETCEVKTNQEAFVKYRYDAEFSECSGAVVTTDRRLLFWRMQNANAIAFADCEGGKQLFVSTNKLLPISVNLAHGLLKPPVSTNVSLYCNLPSCFRFDGEEIEKRHIDAILLSHSPPTALGRIGADALKERARLRSRIAPGPEPEKSDLSLQGEGAMVVERDIIFWQLFAKHLLYLENPDGLSCLLSLTK